MVVTLNVDGLLERAERPETHEIGIQSVLLIALITSNTLVWNPSVLAITDLKSSPKYEPNRTHDAAFYNDHSLPLADRRLIYTPMEKSILFAAVFIGAIFGIFPTEMMLRCFGGFRTTILMGALSTVCSALVPMSVSNNFALLVILRLILGSTLSLAFPLISTIVSSWSAACESGLFVAILTGYLQLSAGFTMGLTGVVASEFGWPVVFYIHSVAMFLLLLLWIFNYKDDPFRHRFVSEVELRKISVGKNIDMKVKPVATPYAEIFGSKAVWGVWIAAGGNYLAGQFCLTFWPAYLVHSLGYSLTAAGFIAVIPLSLQFCAKFLAGVIGQYEGFLSPLNTIRPPEHDCFLRRRQCASRLPP
ncbi:Transporter, major facilitator family protein [Aphelenchoides fujianensis]|nr:Transporter, major facilitator family protein [Aphelenchoides fujianensis]